MPDTQVAECTRPHHLGGSSTNLDFSLNTAEEDGQRAKMCEDYAEVEQQHDDFGSFSPSD